MGRVFLSERREKRERRASKYVGMEYGDTMEYGARCTRLKSRLEKWTAQGQPGMMT